MSAYESCGEVRIALGTYVLGAISPAERARIDAHLSTCPACRDELAGLAGLPARLGRVDEAQISEVAGPPAELLDSLLTRAAARRRTRHWAPPAVAAAVLLAVGIVIGVLLTAGDGPSPPVVPVPSSSELAVEQVSASDPQTQVSAWLELKTRDWGTSVVVRLEGAPPGTRCDLVAVGKDGRRDIAAGWQVGSAWDGGVYAATTFHGSTMIPRADLQSFEIRTVDGRRLLTITPP
ncbi:MAG: anti-sigma factor family protein [Actinomadura sp.]